MVIHRIVSVLERAHALFLVLGDGRTSKTAKLVALVALAWLVFPGDFDVIPLLGWVDDAVVVTGGWMVVERMLPDDVAADLEAKSPRSLRRFVLGALAVFLVLLALAGYVLWRLL